MHVLPAVLCKLCNGRFAGNCCGCYLQANGRRKQAAINSRTRFYAPISKLAHGPTSKGCSVTLVYPKDFAFLLNA